jgi:hypothetical protein
MRYKWSPDVVDSLEVGRMLRIVEETQIDYSEENNSGLEDLE